MQEMQDSWVRFLGRDCPLEKEMATCSSILAWEIPWTEETSGPQSMGCRFLVTWYQYKSALYMSLQVVNVQKWARMFACPITLKYEWNCSSPSISYCWRSLSSTTSLLLSITLLACSLDTAPVCHLLYDTTVLLKVLYYKIKSVSFIFCVCFFMYYLIDSIISLLQYSTI